MYACGNRVNECRGGSWGHVYAAAAHRRRTQDLGESILSSHHVSHYQSPDMSFLSAMRQDSLQDPGHDVLPHHGLQTMVPGDHRLLKLSQNKSFLL